MMNTFRDRIAPLTVAAARLAYLIYALFVHGQAFTALHLWAFALVTLLVLVPFVTRIKIPNIIELDTKLNKLRERTDQELSQLRNAIATVTNVRVNPVLNQYTLLGSENQFKPMIEALTATLRKKDEVIAEDGGIESDRTRFIHQTRRVLDDAQMTLKVARVIQIAYEEKRQFKSDQEDLGPKDPFEKTNFLIDCMVNGGLKYFVPKDEQPATITRLQTYRNLAVIYADVYDRKRKPPGPDQTDIMVEVVGEMTANILAGVALLSGGAVASQRRIEEAIPYFKRGEMPPSEPSESKPS